MAERVGPSNTRPGFHRLITRRAISAVRGAPSNRVQARFGEGEIRDSWGLPWAEADRFPLRHEVMGHDLDSRRENLSQAFLVPGGRGNRGAVDFADMGAGKVAIETQLREVGCDDPGPEPALDHGLDLHICRAPEFVLPVEPHRPVLDRVIEQIEVVGRRDHDDGLIPVGDSVHELQEVGEVGRPTLQAVFAKSVDVLQDNDGRRDVGADEPIDHVERNIPNQEHRRVFGRNGLVGDRTARLRFVGAGWPEKNEPRALAELQLVDGVFAQLVAEGRLGDKVVQRDGGSRQDLHLNVVPCDEQLEELAAQRISPPQLLVEERDEVGNVVVARRYGDRAGGSHALGDLKADNAIVDNRDRDGVFQDGGFPPMVELVVAALLDAEFIPVGRAGPQGPLEDIRRHPRFIVVGK